MPDNPKAQVHAQVLKSDTVWRMFQSIAQAELQSWEGASGQTPKLMWVT